MEAQAVLNSRIVGTPANDKAILLPQISLEGERRLTLVEDVGDSAFHHADERLGYLVA